MADCFAFSQSASRNLGGLILSPMDSARLNWMRALAKPTTQTAGMSFRAMTLRT